MQTSQAIFSALLLSIISAAGLVKGIDTAWIFAGITAALVFFSFEAAGAAARCTRYIDGDRRVLLTRITNVLVVLSWLTGAVAGLSLLV
ncbi:hypothetical protein [Neorhizobium sp. 2083]|uniref:hypothetical protein n=1 Tax=Neorhizobium sp. 2083 TaxID=2817762 RepID=UPI00286B80D2|nr:hypothetical protein [Neorhizobium sp. 2083]